MFLFLLMLAVIVAGLVAMDLCQAARPRDYSVLSDDLERRLLRTRTGLR
jgi:hypothetical protein